MILSNYEINDFVPNNKTRLYTYANPTNYYFLLKHSKKFDKIYSDGLLLTFLYNKKTKSVLERYSPDDTSLLPLLFDSCKQHNLKIFFVGCTSEQIQLSVENISNKYNLKTSVGFIDGYKTVDELVSLSLKFDFDVCISGLGSPKQEKYLYRLSKIYHKPFIGMACGGYLYQSFYSHCYYPTFINKFNLRWLLRFIRHSHVRRKLIYEYPKFMLKWYGVLK